MSVQELIELLEECDQEATVVLDVGGLNLIEASKVEEEYAIESVIIS